MGRAAPVVGGRRVGEAGSVADERHDAAFVVGAILGGVAGATYTLFNAPQAGAQTRAQLAERRDAVAERLAAAIAEVDGRVRRLVAQVGAAARPVVERLASARPGSAPAEVEVATEPAAEPVFTLPDPLEPDPVVREEPAAGMGEDIVIEGPRPAAHAAEP